MACRINRLGVARNAATTHDRYEQPQIDDVEAHGSSAHLFLIEPAKSFQVEAVFVVELDAFLFQQASLEGVAAIAR